MLIATDWPLTDWPTPEINAFWDEHGVLSGTVQSVLLFGVGLLSYEAGQLRAQERLDESVTAAGLGGIVDHVVDVEVGLAFLSSPAAARRARLGLGARQAAAVAAAGP